MSAVLVDKFTAVINGTVERGFQTKKEAVHYAQRRCHGTSSSYMVVDDSARVVAKNRSRMKGKK